MATIQASEINGHEESLFDLPAAAFDDVEEGEALPPALYVFDFETDPFKEWKLPSEQRIPKVFAVGVYCITSQKYECHWGRGDRDEAQQDCVDFLLSIMDAAPPGSMFFAHNGGKFDFHFFKDELRGAIKVIGARIAQCRVGHVVIRDSYAMLPEPLSRFGGKLDIDYAKMEPDVRIYHKAEILHYMKADCLTLARAIIRFIAEFGLHLTMAGASMKQMRKFCPFDKIESEKVDADIRQFYFGGRVECIEGSGHFAGPWKLLDVNGMYPSVMRDFLHPVSSDYIEYLGPYAQSILPRCDFAQITAINRGCLPAVVDGKLTFRQERGEFFATGHEIRAGLDTGTIEILKVHKAWKGTRHANFQPFIDHFTAKRYAAKQAEDKLLDLFYKRIQNSGYGKTGQDPSKYKDWEVTEEIYETASGWTLQHIFPDNKLRIWSRKSATPSYAMRYNVGIAASITGAARSQLWRGLCQAERPIYCDTDSMMCRDYRGDLDPVKLGAWKLEAEAASVAIAGRKLYAMFDGGGKAIKQASKGVRVSADDIAAVAGGNTVTYRNEVPTFSLKKQTHFVTRKVKRTS